MARKKSFWEQVTDVASRAYDQVNPFDGGKTWSNRVARPAAPRRGPSAIDRGVQFATDMNNATYGTALKVGKSVWDGVQAAPRTVGEGLAVAISPAVREANQAQLNLQNSQNDILRRAGQARVNPGLSTAQRQRWQGLAEQTSQQSADTFKAADERNARQIDITDPKKQLAAYGSLGLDVATAGMGTGIKAGVKGFAPVARQIAKQGAKTAAVTGASGALYPVIEKGDEATVGDIATGALVGGTVGAVLPGAIYGVSRGISKGAPAVSQATKKTVKVVNQANPAAKELDRTLAQYKKAFDVETDPARRAQINQGIADLNAQRRTVAEGGFIGGKKPEAIQAGKEARQAADEFAESKISTKDRAQDFVRDNLTDDTKYFQDLDKRGRTRNWYGKVNDTPADESLDAQIQAFRNTKAMQRQRQDDIGITDFAKKLSSQDDYDGYRVYRTYRTNAERAAKNTQKGESVDQAYARFSGGRDMAEDARLYQQLDQDPKYNALFTEENQITQKILRDRGDNPNLSMSRADAEALIAEYPNYTPQYRTMSEDLIQMRKGGNVGSTQGKNVKKLQGGSKTKPIEDPLTALREYSDELVSKSQGNDVMSLLLKKAPEKFRTVVSADQIKAKEAARITMAELKDIATPLIRQIKGDKKLARRLQIELNQLNKEGLSKSLKNKRDPSLSKKLVNPNLPVSKAELDNIIEDLVNRRPADVQRIVDKISTREPKLAFQLDELRRLNQTVDDIKSERAGIMKSGDLDAFEKASGKNTRRRVVDGKEEIYEVLDPRLAKQLDNLSGHQLSDAAAVLGVPTRIFKFFTTGPGNVIGFAPIAVTRDVLASILFAKAPIRSAFDPRSYIDAVGIALKKGSLYKDLQRRGISGTMAESDRQVKATTSDAMRNRGIKRIKVYTKGRDGLNQLGRDIEELDMSVERFTRGRLAAGRYRQSLARYKNDSTLTPQQARDKALWDAAEEFREGALNFGRSGRVIRELNAVVPYLNPAVQAGNKVRRTMVENPVGFAARASLATSLLYGAYAYSTSDPERKAVYDKIEPEEKRGNIVIVLPGTTFNDDTGKTEGGLIKIPLPYEFRPMSVGVEAAFNNSDDNEYGDMALAGLSFLTGLDTRNVSSLVGQFMPNLIKAPVENLTNWSFYRNGELVPDYIKETANGDKTLEKTKRSSGSANFISRATNGIVSPIEVDNTISNLLGGASKDITSYADKALNSAGLISDEETTDSNPLSRLRKRYTESYGKSDAIRFFDRLDEERKSLVDEKDRKAFDFLHAKNETPGYLDSPEKVGIYLNRPEVVKRERRLNEASKAEGKPSNPLFDLPDDQLQKVLLYRHSKMLNAGKQTYDKNGNPLFTSLGLDEDWYQAFRDRESEFYNKIGADKAKREGKSAAEVAAIRNGEAADEDYASFSGATKPVASDELQALLDAYNELPKGDGSRSAMLRAYPEILEFWEANDGFTNKERKAIGLKPLEDEEGFGGSGGSGGSRYARSGRGGGSRGSGGGTPDTMSAGNGISSPGSAIKGQIKKVAVKKKTAKKIVIKRGGRI